LPPEAGHIAELASRIGAQLESHLVLTRKDLAVDGNELMTELGLSQGPLLGDLLNELTEHVVSEPALNDREILLDMSRRLIFERRLVENPDL